MILLKEISHNFDDNLILKNINYKFKRNKYLITGPSGIGKTTLLKIINKELIPSKGSVESMEKTGMIYQDFKLLNSFTVKENIEIALNILKIKKNYNNIITLLKIEHILDKYPDEISGGENQRAAIARTLAAGNKYIIADEPTSSLDQENSQNIINTFDELYKELYIGFIISSHDSLWNNFADHILTIENKKLKTKND